MTEKIEWGTEPVSGDPVKRYLQVISKTAYVVDSPGPNYNKILNIVHKGEWLVWQGLTNEQDGVLWYMVEVGSASGWISEKDACLLLS